MRTRTIKFRVWDKESGSWLGNDDICYMLSEKTDSNDALNNFFKDDSIVVQQYTGLKSPDGKEIYEGDIIEVLSINSSTLQVKNVVGEVIWGEYGDDEYVNNVECWTADGIPLSSMAKSWGIRYNRQETDPNTLKVVGNIFETPELLTKVEMKKEVCGCGAMDCNVCFS